jgi:hypothetical protein
MLGWRCCLGENVGSGSKLRSRSASHVRFVSFF